MNLNKLVTLFVGSALSGIASMAQPKVTATTSPKSAATASTKAAAPSPKTVYVYTTAARTDLRLSSNGQLNFSPYQQPMETEPFVLVDPSASFQSILGFGGALTDASAETFAKLSKDKQQELLTAYYDTRKGIGYTLARTHIQSCDFSSGSYSYVADNDAKLKTFSIAMTNNTGSR